MKPIFFDIAPCPLGFMIVAATSQGACWIALGDEESALETELRQALPQATRDATAVQTYTENLVRFLNGESANLRVALDVDGTPFQHRVWQALRAIPCGQTRTYTQIAEALDAPRSVRAVARACATNRVALLIPCHRAVRADGSLAGFRWGLERKEALLKLEAQQEADSFHNQN
jgi:O-6-methylguanine DNA methyltransferase